MVLRFSGRQEAAAASIDDVDLAVEVHDVESWCKEFLPLSRVLGPYLIPEIGINSVICSVSNANGIFGVVRARRLDTFISNEIGEKVVLGRTQALIDWVFATPEMRGRKIAKHLIVYMTKYLTDKYDVQDILAFVHKDNTASRKTFENGGFRFDREVNPWRFPAWRLFRAKLRKVFSEIDS